MKIFIALLKTNWKSGLAVALINIPLSISLAVASLGINSTNAPLLGLITAIWGGVMAAIFGSNQHNIYGPAGALSGILLAFVLHQNSGVIYIPFVAITAGIIILIISWLRLTKYITLIPSSSLHGFLMGVGITIAVSQLNSAFGIIPQIQHEAIYQNILQTLSQIYEINWLTFLLFGAGLVFLFIIKRMDTTIPGAIPLTFLGIIIGWGCSYLHSHNLWPQTLPVIPTLADKFPALTFSLINTPNYSIQDNIFNNIDIIKLILRYGSMIAVVAILETMISSKIAEKLTKVPFNKDREIFGLGVANLMSGLMGGMPATSVLVRTAFNIKSGATHRVSALLAAIFTLVISWLFFDLFRYLPMPIIAAILMNISIGLIDIQLYRHIYAIDKVSFYFANFVAIITVVDDPIVGIILGTALSLLVFIGKTSRGNADITIFRNKKLFDKVHLENYLTMQDSRDIIIYRFASTLNYINIESNLEQATKIIKPSVIIFSFGQVNFVDMDGIETFKEIFEHFKKIGIEMYFTGISNHNVETILKRFPIFTEIENKGNIYKSSAFVMEKLDFFIQLKSH